MTNEGSWSLKKPKKHGKSSGNHHLNAEECRVEQPEEHKSHGKYFRSVKVNRNVKLTLSTEVDHERVTVSVV